MLIPFIIWGVAISWFAIHGLFFLSLAVEDQPRVEIGSYKVDEDYAVTFIKQGENLIVQLEQKVKRGKESVLEKSSTVFEKAFDPVVNDKDQGKVQDKLEELYKALLPKLASYQAWSRPENCGQLWWFRHPYGSDRRDHSLEGAGRAVQENP